MAAIEVKANFRGFDSVNLLLGSTLKQAAQATVVAGAMKKSARPLVRQVRSMYKALGGSGSLAIATKAYRKKGRNSTIVHVGPVRGSAQALARYYAHYRPSASVRGFGSGLRHAHLVEWGAKRQKQGTMRGYRILERSWNATRAQVMADFQKIFAADVQKAILRRRR